MSHSGPPAVLKLILAGLLWLVAGAPRVVSAAEPAALQLWPQGSHSKPDPETDTFVDQLMSRMSLAEKVAQMIQADIASITPEELRTYKLGSILAGGNAAPGGNVRTSPSAWAELTTQFHRAALAARGAHQPIPILFGIDAVHGDAKLIGATIFPHNVALGAAHDTELIRRIGEATAQEVALTGVDWTFAPTVAVVRDVRWGRSYESYSESPELVAEYTPAMLAGLQGTPHTAQFLGAGHTLGSIKHFLGDGGTLNGRDQFGTVIPESELRTVHAAGYLAGLNAGALIVMASYNSWNGVKLHANRYLLTDVLKGRLAFDGFIVGDWNAHEQVPGCTKTDCPAAILAGVDMLMAPDSWKGLYQNTLAEAQSGKIPAARIDDAVRRILRVKVIAGLFRRAHPAAPDLQALKQLGSPAHREIAREAVRESLVLLKNERGILPLKPASKILVAGSAADDIRTQCGGWTVDWQGDHNRNVDFPGATSIYGGIRRAAADAGGTATLSPDGTFENRPDVAVVVFGEGPYAEFQGDRETLEFSPNDKHDLQLLRRLRSQGIPIVSIFLSGRPLWVNPEINASDAFVAAWLPGSEGEGVADVLLRGADGTLRYDFTGRLGFSWPRTALPVAFGASGEVSGAQFARGAGLSYRSPSSLPELPEDSGIAAERKLPPGTLFYAVHPVAPWSVFVGDRGDEVHLTTDRQASPHGDVVAELRPEGIGADWNGHGRGMLMISGRPADLDGSKTAITMRYRIDREPTGEVLLGVRCVQAMCATAAGASADLTETFKSAPIGVWKTLSVPLSCLTRAQGAVLKEVDAPFVLSTAGALSMTLAEVALTPRLDSSRAECPQGH